MSRRRNVMSEQLKNELAKDLGIYDTVQREGWAVLRRRMPAIWLKEPFRWLSRQLLSSSSRHNRPPKHNFKMFVNRSNQHKHNSVQ